MRVQLADVELEGVGAVVVGVEEPEALACKAAAGRVEGCAVEGDIDLVLLAWGEVSGVGLADGDVEEACCAAGAGGVEAEDGLVAHGDCAECGVAGEGDVVGFTVDSYSEGMAWICCKCWRGRD